MARSLLLSPPIGQLRSRYGGPDLVGFLDAVGWLVHFIPSVCGFVCVSTEHAYGAYVAAGN